MREGLDSNHLRSIYNRVAKRYDVQHGLLTAKSDQRGRRLLVERAVSTGDVVLDCGAGTGSTGLLAARKVGESGKVVLYDLSEGMLAVARAKAERMDLAERLDFQVGNLLTMPFDDGSFDTVLSTYSLCPVVDPARGAAELFRVARPCGRIGVAHSTDPQSRIARGLADLVERTVWHFPSISLGCRSVSVLPTLEDLGCRVQFKKHIGMPLWPFLVFVVEKPDSGEHALA